MLSKDEIKQELERTQKYLEHLLKENPHPDDVDDLKEAKQRLNDLHVELEKSWPIEDTVKATAMGVFAMKSLENGPFGELPKMMMILAQNMGGGD